MRAEASSAGLAELAKIEDDQRLAGHHRVESVRAHILELAGAVVAYRVAARLTTSPPERRYLESRAASQAGG